jgi:hypothetical protein
VQTGGGSGGGGGGSSSIVTSFGSVGGGGTNPQGIERCVAVLLGISSASSSCRRRTWLALFGVSDDPSSPFAPHLAAAADGSEDHQVRLDVNRCLYCHDLPELLSAVSPAPSAAADASLAARRQQLYEVIVGVIRSDACFKYTQGFHDFCAAVLPVIGVGGGVGDDGAVVRAFICAVGRRHLRPSLCDPNLDAASAACSRVFRALFAIDQPLALHLDALAVNPIVCLSWILTLFTHPLSGHKAEVNEVLDFIFASDDDYTVLLSACIIADNASALLQVQDSGDAFKAVLDCPNLSLLRTHRRRSCLCRALQISLSKYARDGVAAAAATAACTAAAAPSMRSAAAGMRSEQAPESETRPCVSLCKIAGLVTLAK